ncbi:hypothetical protein LEP1GSC133_0977 [Leptospira borgpetersenii serovar Pomona str. 200901868]|nr:hypothetical protein LEP1GSC133_0977 [Leptospira borgpetersenii serovar Pomona str. 200901868]
MVKSLKSNIKIVHIYSELRLKIQTNWGFLFGFDKKRDWSPIPIGLFIFWEEFAFWNPG